jgi:ATP-dependent helicase YprA (DUF1998 family)
VVEGRDVLLVSATGSGKSLTYQQLAHDDVRRVSPS